MPIQHIIFRYNMKKDTKKFLDFSNILADKARLISLKYFKKKLRIKNKKRNNFDPVTEADVKIQKKLNLIRCADWPPSKTKCPHLLVSSLVLCKTEQFVEAKWPLTKVSVS